MRHKYAGSYPSDRGWRWEIELPITMARAVLGNGKDLSPSNWMNKCYLICAHDYLRVYAVYRHDFSFWLISQDKEKLTPNELRDFDRLLNMGPGVFNPTIPIYEEEAPPYAAFIEEDDDELA